MTGRNRNDSYVPDGLYLEGHPQYVEVTPPHRYLDVEAAERLLYQAWTVIANVSEGDWTKQPFEWQAAAGRWRDSWHSAMELTRQPKVARVAFGLADELNRKSHGQWWWADVSGDGTHWSWFQGHRMQVDVALHTENRREVNHWKGRDEVRAGGTWTLHLNRQPMGDGYFGENVGAALERIRHTITALAEHPALDHSSGVPYDEQLRGRRVYYREQPAVVASTVLSRGCVMLEPVGAPRFLPPVWRVEEAQRGGLGYDDSENNEALVELESPHVWWWRDEMPGEAEELAARRAFEKAMAREAGTTKTVGAPAELAEPSGERVEVTAEPDQDPEGADAP